MQLMMPITNTSRGAALVSMIHAEFPNYHPLLSIARLAHHPEADLRLQFECHKCIVKYIEPELKSVELKSDVREEKTVRVSLFDVEDANIITERNASSHSDLALSNW
jgi:hypothetical protein